MRTVMFKGVEYQIPKPHTCIAVDEDGSIFSYHTEPAADRTVGWWVEDDAITQHIPFWVIPKYLGSYFTFEGTTEGWYESLEKV